MPEVHDSRRALRYVCCCEVDPVESRCYHCLDGYHDECLSPSVMTPDLLEGLRE